MVDKNNEPRDDSASEATDLDLDDIGVSVAASTIDLDPRSLPIIALAIIVAGVLFVLFSNIAQTMTAFVIALLFALALDPLIVKIQYLSFRRLPIQQKVDAKGNPVQRIGRYVAVSIALGTFLFFALLGAYLVAPTVVNEINGIPRQIPKTVEGLKDLPFVGERLGSEQTQANIENFLEQLPQKLSAQDSPLGDFVRSFFDGAYLGLLFVLMFVTLLLDGPRIVRNFRRFIRPTNRHAADRLALATHRVVGKYMAGSIFVAVLAGLIIGTAGLLLGVPLAPLVGVWIMFTNLIPQIGGFLGGVPFVVLGFTESPMTGLACLAIFIAYQQIENHLIQPIVVGKTVKISPPVTMVAALIGVAAGGVLGAMIAVPTVGAAKALAAEFDFPRGARAKAMELDSIDEENIKRAHLPKEKSKK